MTRREEMLNGVLSFPQQIHDLVKASKHDRLVAENMLQRLYTLFISDSPVTSTINWYERFNSVTKFNAYLKHLSKAGWIISQSKIPGRPNWADITLNTNKLTTYVSTEELSKLIRTDRFDHYVLENTTYNSAYDGCRDTKLPSGIQDTGIIRMGSAKAGNRHEFKYDIKYMKKYYKEIIAYSISAMKKMEEELGYSLITDAKTDYTSVIETIIQHHILNPDERFTLGKLLNDSRGRSIYDAVRRVFGPISNKIARALIICPAYTIEPEDIKEVYLFIAEILYGHSYDIDAKAEQGRQAYLNNELLDLDLTDPEGVKDLYENIWLERVYAEIKAYHEDNNHQWTVPGELDFGASNMVIIGCLLNHKPLLTEYMWSINGLSKLHVKKAETPYVFGSAAPVANLWRKAGLKFTTKDLALMQHHMTRGKFAVPNAFKDLIINNCNLSARQPMHVRDEKFVVECNRYKNVGDTTRMYQIYDTATDKVQMVKHTKTHKVPDLKQFKRYPVTGLIHNIDSQIMNKLSSRLSWVLPIYDACVTPFSEFKKMRAIGTAELEDIRANRGTILTNYFKSIGFQGINPLKEFKALKAICEPFDGPIDPYHILK